MAGAARSGEAPGTLVPWKSRIAPGVLPIKSFPLLRVVPDLVHRLGLEEPPVDHSILDAGGIPDILEGVFGQHQ